MQAVYILSAARTPIGKFGGSLASLTAADMGVVAARASIERAAIQPAQIKIEMTTEPSSPQKGKNSVRIKLTGPDGKPVDGVQVSAIFVMPAMPAMGMAAQHAAAALSARGQGVYLGPLELDSGGTWQVIVTVQRAGAIIATQKLTVDATGGM